LSSGLRIWQATGPGAAVAWAEAQRGLSEDQIVAIHFGRNLEEPLPEVEITSLSDGRLGNAIGSSFSVLIVSPAARNVLTVGAAQALQFIEVQLPVPGADGYTIVNVVEHVPAFDEARSDVERLPAPPDRIVTVRKLALADVPGDAPPIFHIAEFPGPLVVRDELRARLEALGDAGEFIPIDDYEVGLV
jgi:hypothetical protein